MIVSTKWLVSFIITEHGESIRFIWIYESKPYVRKNKLHGIATLNAIFTTAADTTTTTSVPAAITITCNRNILPNIQKSVEYTKIYITEISDENVTIVAIRKVMIIVFTSYHKKNYNNTCNYISNNGNTIVSNYDCN